MNILKTFAGVAALGGAFAAYNYKIRSWHLRWGASVAELSATLPGDEVKPDAAIQVTHAITIDAPAAVVWKWLVQIGQQRGGFYSYDWLENLFGLKIHNTREIKPVWQTLKVGDFVRSAHDGWLGGRFKNKAGWFVVAMDELRSLVLRDEIERGSWAFILRPVNEAQTRLIIRARGNEPQGAALKIFHYGFFEPAHFIMERKMLLTLKKRAEEFSANHTDEAELNLTAEKISV
ncbi:MAG TPA: SRPBCC family protein [Pyrinomonadaceae bacterium]